MKLVLVLLSICLLPLLAHGMEDAVAKAMRAYRAAHVAVTPGAQKFTLQRPEGERSYYVYVPKAYADKPTAVPLVFAFHGLGDSCENFGPAVGISDEAEKRNFLYVYPCATVGALGTGWNAGTCCVSGVDDVAFTRAMVGAVSSNFMVDSSRIFVTGFSNGAFMAEILGCVAPDVFSATVSVSGVVEMLPGNAQGLAACTAAYSNFTQRVSTLNIHGTLDFVVPWTGDALLGFPPIPDNFAAWAARNNCTGQPSQTLNKGPFTNQIYTQCDSGTRVELVENSGGGHQWPHTSDFQTTSYLCDFFKL